MYDAVKSIKFNPNGKNRYTHIETGLPVHGVTSIIDKVPAPAIPYWYSKITSQYWRDAMEHFTGEEDLDEIAASAKSAPKQQLIEAGNIGTEVHNYIESVLNGTSIPTIGNQQVKNATKAWEDWREGHVFKPVHIERVCFSLDDWYAGTLDCEGTVDGDYELLDWKTSGGIYAKARFQTAAYQKARWEEDGTEFVRRRIVRLDKNTGTWEELVIPECDYPRDLHGFLSCLELHKVLKEIENDKSLR